MPAIICPFCQHENNSGTRFCTECGSSIHLKICPNSQCGKISEIDAEFCQSCGGQFPEIGLVPKKTTGSTESGVTPKQDGNANTIANDRPRAAAWPLIIVAIVAGGLPLLWANRTLLPTPKTWQTNTADPTKASGATMLIEQTAPPALANIVPPPLPAKAFIPGEPDLGSPSSRLGPTDTGGTTKPEEIPSAPSEAPKVVKAPPVKAVKKPPPCSEAMAALALCVPQHPEK